MIQMCFKLIILKSQFPDIKFQLIVLLTILVEVWRVDHAEKIVKDIDWNS